MRFLLCVTLLTQLLLINVSNVTALPPLIIGAIVTGITGVTVKIVAVIKNRRNRRAIEDKQVDLFTSSAASASATATNAQTSFSIVASNISIPLIVNGVEFIFNFKPDRVSVANVAMEFCYTHGSEMFNIDVHSSNDDDINECISSVAQVITQKIEKLELIKRSDIIFNPRGMQNEPIAATSDGDAHTITVNSDSDEPLLEEVQEDEQRQIILEINSINYVFEFLKAVDIRDVATQLAEEFCYQKGHVLKLPGYEPEAGATDANLKILTRGCITPIALGLIDNDSQTTAA